MTEKNQKLSLVELQHTVMQEYYSPIGQDI